MGCRTSMPKVDGFLTDQPMPANGYILGELASTAAGNVSLRYSGGITNRGFAPGVHPTTNSVTSESSDVIFTVHRAGNLNKQWIREPTIVKDAGAKTIAMLKSDSTTTPVCVGNSYTGYCSAPRFDGQGAAFNVDGVPMYSAFRVQNLSTKPDAAGNFGSANFNVYLMRDAAAFDLQPAFTLVTHADGAAMGAGVAHGKSDLGGKITLTVAKGMDAGLAVLAGFAPDLLVGEMEAVDGGGPIAAF
eukprot:g1964.t1